MKATLVVVGLLACKQGPEHPEVELVLGVGGIPPQGFRCKVAAESDSLLMSTARTCNGTDCRFALMIDFVDMGPSGGEAPSCRPLEVRAWCTDPNHDCATIDRARVCRDVVFKLADAQTQCDRLQSGIANIATPLLALDPPDRLVYVRAVALEGDCAKYGYNSESVSPPSEIKSPQELFNRADLLGCAQSCPVVLDGWRGALTLDLDTVDACTLDTVENCALNVYEELPPPVCD